MKIEWSTIPKECRNDDKDFPSGTVFFTGRQGAGKTLSAGHYIARLKERFPDLYIYSNIQYALADKVITSEEVAKYILDKRPDGAPIAFLLDEVQTVLFNGKKAISLEVFKSVCQQRKAKKTIIGTAQSFLDIDINYRRDEQILSVVQCSHIGKFQIESWETTGTLNPQTNKYEGERIKGNALYGGLRIWKRHNDAFDMYDTYEIVSQVMQINNDLRPKPQNASIIVNNNTNQLKGK